VLAVAWYRFRATFGRRWTGYLTVAVLVGLLGGLAMGAVAAGRRTQSAFATYLASTNPSELRMVTGGYNPAVASDVGYGPAFIRAIAHLPHVTHVESSALLNVVLYVGPHGALGPNIPPAAGDPDTVNSTGSIDGLYFDEDRVTVTQGRMPDPTRADEVLVQASQADGVPVGQVFSIGIYTNADEAQPGFSTAETPYRRINAKVVGFGVSNDAVVTDAVDAGGSFSVLFTPAFTRQFLNCCTKATFSAIQVRGGSRSVATVEAEATNLERRDGAVGEPIFYVTSVTEAKAERAIRPEAIALGVFGVIAGLAALLIAGQAIGRQLRLRADDLPVLRALGTSPSMIAVEGLIGLAASLVVGALLAVAVAIGLSPLAPIGVVRPVYPDAGVAFDWTVFALGFVVLVVGLGGFAILATRRQGPHRTAQRQQRAGTRRPGLAHRAATSGLPAPAVVGIGFAVNPEVGRSSVPVRSAIVGVSLAVVVLTATLVFGSSLHTLVTRPALYGWNWNDELVAGGGSSDIPQQQVTQLLRHDSDVTAWAGVYFGALDLDDVQVPVLGANPGASVAPPILSGHPFDAPDQVVLGALTLAQLHKHIGDSVLVSSGRTAPTRLQIVGTAAMPAIGSNGTHLEMGTGALLSSALLPSVARNPLDAVVTGPNAIFVRLRRGASATPLRQIANELSNTSDGGVDVVPVQRPAEIINYRSLGATPALLGGALAVGAASAFGLTLISSIRRRRRDVALLKTLGFTRPQLAATVAWQSSVAVAIGVVVGAPVGIVFGRWLWDLFAQNIDVVPAPTIPVVSIVLIALGALLLANLVAAVPGVIAARTKTASLLRAE
jgi:ABC-type antimicrobial peptide transport system permease subunit